MLAVRLSRPTRISIRRLWIGPIVLAAIAALAIYASQTMEPAGAWQIAVAMLGGLVVGTPLGVLRGLHTDVRPTDRKGVMQLGASWVVIVIFAGAFALRALLRFALPQHGAVAALVGDGLLAFAVGFVVAGYFVIYRKYRFLTHS